MTHTSIAIHIPAALPLPECRAAAFVSAKRKSNLEPTFVHDSFFRAQMGQSGMPHNIIFVNAASAEMAKRAVIRETHETPAIVTELDSRAMLFEAQEGLFRAFLTATTDPETGTLRTTNITRTPLTRYSVCKFFSSAFDKLAMSLVRLSLASTTRLPTSANDVRVYNFRRPAHSLKRPRSEPKIAPTF